MIRRITMLVVAALLALCLSASVAFAQSPSQRECEAQGGTFSRDGGQVQCVVVTEDEGKNPKFTQETETTTTGQGNIRNKQQETEATECQQDGQTRGNCPPGQFKD